MKVNSNSMVSKSSRSGSYVTDIITHSKKVSSNTEAQHKQSDLTQSDRFKAVEQVNRPLIESERPYKSYTEIARQQRESIQQSNEVVSSPLTEKSSIQIGMMQLNGGCPVVPNQLKHQDQPISQHSNLEQVTANLFLKVALDKELEVERKSKALLNLAQTFSKLQPKFEPPYI